MHLLLMLLDMDNHWLVLCVGMMFILYYLYMKQKHFWNPWCVGLALCVSILMYTKYQNHNLRMIFILSGFKCSHLNSNFRLRTHMKMVSKVLFGKDANLDNTQCPFWTNLSTLSFLILSYVSWFLFLKVLNVFTLNP